MSDEGWEARMAARARDRERVSQAKVSERGKPDDPAPQPEWLNGWYRPTAAGSILIGTESHCVCCGRSRGITCVAFSSDWEPPGPDPIWPFHPDDCPLCLALGWT